MSRISRPLAALAMLAVIVPGCSSAPGGTDSGGGKSTAPAGTGSRVLVTSDLNLPVFRIA
jgi:hypothetical protein